MACKASLPGALVIICEIVQSSKSLWCTRWQTLLHKSFAIYWNVVAKARTSAAKFLALLPHFEARKRLSHCLQLNPASVLIATKLGSVNDI